VSLIPASSATLVIPDLTPEDVADAFLRSYGKSTRQSYHRDLRTWFTYCADNGIAPLMASRDDVSTFALHMDETDGLSPATRARRLSTLSGFYQWATDENVIARNPVVRVKRPKVGTDSQSTGLDKSELSAILTSAALDGPRSHALVLLLGFNGLRISEALQADVTDLTTERGHHVIRITRKGGKTATVPLAPRTADAIDLMLDGRTTGPLFATAKGTRLDRVAAWRVIRKLARRAVPAKADSLHPHDFRHAFVTLSLDADVPLHEVQDAAGHADPRTTQRYNRARHSLDKHPTYALAGMVE
jgi:integrase/recombinase XerD